MTSVLKHRGADCRLMELLRRKSPGFTLFEILAVLMIILLVGLVVVFSSDYSTIGYDLKVETELIKTNLRYAQARAMNTDVVWGIEFSSDNKTYFLFKNGNTDDKVFLPAETYNSVTLPDGMTITVATVSFDSRGKPYTDAAAQTAQEVDGGWREISVSFGGDTETIRIRNNTGFIP